jgi:hypothetical protein
VAWSAAAGDAGEVLEVRVEVDSWLVGVGADGRVGSVLGDIEGLPGWFGFHISLVLPFVYFLDTGPRNNPAGFVSAFKGKIRWSCSFLSHFACSAKIRASREILALLCILTTLSAKLKSPIPNLSGFRGG